MRRPLSAFRQRPCPARSSISPTWSGARHLRRAFEDAERLRLLDLTSLREVRARSPGRRGLRVFDAVLAEIDVPPDTLSELERLFFELCRENGLPLPETNAVVAGFEADALWSQHRLIVELDGYAYHRTRAAFERDRKRDAALQLAGYRVLWITFRRLLEEPELVAEEIRRLLAQGA